MNIYRVNLSTNKVIKNLTFWKTKTKNKEIKPLRTRRNTRAASIHAGWCAKRVEILARSKTYDGESKAIINFSPLPPACGPWRSETIAAEKKSTYIRLENGENGHEAAWKLG